MHAGVRFIERGMKEVKSYQGNSWQSKIMVG